MFCIYSTKLLALSRLLLLLVCTTPSLAVCEKPIKTKVIDFEGRSFAFYALSQGKGVPDATWAMLEELRARFLAMKAQGSIVRLQDERLGLEGETRLCAEFSTTVLAQSTWQQVFEEVKKHDLELVNLKIEACNEQ